MKKNPVESIKITSGIPASTELTRGQPSESVLVRISGIAVPDCSCHLVGIDAGILYVRSESQIAESSSVVVSFDRIQLSGVIAGCQPIDREWVISIALASCKRRLEARVPADAACIVGVVGRRGTKPLHGSVVDQSSSGLGLRLARPIETGTRVFVETQSMIVFGEVRYCRTTFDGQFIAGVMIVDVAPDLRSQNPFSIALNNLRWKLASRIRGKDVRAYRPDR